MDSTTAAAPDLAAFWRSRQGPVPHLARDGLPRDGLPRDGLVHGRLVQDRRPDTAAGPPTSVAGHAGPLRFAFAGRVSTEDMQDPAASRGWQLSRAVSLIAERGRIVAEYFDVGQSRAVPWPRRPQAAALLAAIKDPARGWDAVVIGEPQRAFYGHQFGLTFPLFAHYGVPLWVPEVGGPIDPASEGHELVMVMFGGISKGERNRIKVRVRTTMQSLTACEGRWLGGRPPYGYQLIDAGRHPNPAKAALGIRLHELAPDPRTERLVRWIYARYLTDPLGGPRCRRRIAAVLNRAGCPCPSALDPTRRDDRTAAGWTPASVLMILTNPRYTGYQVWGRHHTEEVLLDVDDVALGHKACRRPSDPRDWVWSQQPAHAALVSYPDFIRVQVRLAERKHRAVRPTRRYLLAGLLVCGLCGGGMQARRRAGRAYYRCDGELAPPGHGRPDGKPDGPAEEPAGVPVEGPAGAPAEGPVEAVAGSSARHRPAVVWEQEIAPALDAWIATAFNGPGLQDCVRMLQQALQQPGMANGTGPAAPAAPTVPTVPTMTSTQIADLIAGAGDVAQLLARAEPEARAALYAALGVSLLYQPALATVLVNQSDLA